MDIEYKKNIAAVFKNISEAKKNQVDLNLQKYLKEANELLQLHFVTIKLFTPTNNIQKNTVDKDDNNDVMPRYGYECLCCRPLLDGESVLYSLQGFLFLISYFIIFLK